MKKPPTPQQGAKLKTFRAAARVVCQDLLKNSENRHNVKNVIRTED